MKQKLKVGVVGVGHLGSLHAKMYAEIDNINFVGVFDVTEGNRNEIASKYKVKAFSSLEEMLREVDAVSIATVTTSHHQVAVKALEAGVHVLIEKPITVTIAEADELIDLAKKKNLIIQVGHIERFNPAIMAVETYTLNPMFIESHRLAQFNPRGTDVAVVLDLMIHDIDIILSLVNSPVQQVDANGVAVVSEHPDIANARLKFENGCVANVTASRISRTKMRKMRLFQSNAYMSLDFTLGQADVFRLGKEGESGNWSTLLLGNIGEGKKKRSIIYEQPSVKKTNALKVELESFVRTVENSSRPIVSGEDGRHALEVAQEIMEKIQIQNFNVA